jgi:hypothetical protein
MMPVTYYLWGRVAALEEGGDGATVVVEVEVMQRSS